jgi:hypothetical protein
VREKFFLPPLPQNHRFWWVEREEYPEAENTKARIRLDSGLFLPEISMTESEKYYANSTKNFVLIIKGL